MLGQRAGDAQRQAGVLVGAVGVAQVLAEVAVADDRVASSAKAASSASCARRARSAMPRALASSADEQHAVVRLDRAERVAARQRAAELVQREPEPRALGGAELELRVPPVRRTASTPIRRAGDQHVAGGELVGGRVARRGVVAEQHLEQPHLELPLRLLEFVAAVHRRADLRRASARPPRSRRR